MIHKASKLIAAAFDSHGIKYGNTINEAGVMSYVEAGFNIDNGPSVLVRFISNDDDNDVAVRVLKLLNVTSNKRDSIIAAINDINEKYRYVKFTIDSDGDVNVGNDFPIRLSDDCVGEVAFETFIRFMQIIDDCYSDLMRALYA